MTNSNFVTNDELNENLSNFFQSSFTFIQQSMLRVKSTDAQTLDTKKINIYESLLENSGDPNEFALNKEKPPKHVFIVLPKFHNREVEKIGREEIKAAPADINHLEQYYQQGYHNNDCLFNNNYQNASGSNQQLTTKEHYQSLQEKDLKSNNFTGNRPMTDVEEVEEEEECSNSNANSAARSGKTSDRFIKKMENFTGVLSDQQAALAQKIIKNATKAEEKLLKEGEGKKKIVKEKTEPLQLTKKEQINDKKKNGFSIEDHLKRLSAKEMEICENLKKFDQQFVYSNKYEIPPNSHDFRKQNGNINIQNFSHHNEKSSTKEPEKCFSSAGNIKKCELDVNCINKNHNVKKNSIESKNKTVKEEITFGKKHQEQLVDNFYLKNSSDHNFTQSKQTTTNSTNKILSKSTDRKNKHNQNLYFDEDQRQNIHKTKVYRLPMFIKELHEQGSPGFFYSDAIKRNEVWLRAKKLRENIQRNNINEKIMNECTFYPRKWSSSNYKKYLSNRFDSTSQLDNETYLKSTQSMFTYVNLWSPHDKSRSLSKEKKLLNSYTKALEIRQVYKNDMLNSGSKYLPSDYTSPKKRNLHRQHVEQYLSLSPESHRSNRKVGKFTSQYSNIQGSSKQVSLIKEQTNKNLNAVTQNFKNSKKFLYFFK